MMGKNNKEKKVVFFDMFDKLDDCVQTIVDATFGWSKTLQEKHLENVRTKNATKLKETEAKIEAEKKKLEAELAERNKQFQVEIEKEQNEERRKMLQIEHDLYVQEIQFKVSQVEKLTKIVSGLQSEHSKKVMALLTEYKQQQILIIADLKKTSNDYVNQITTEAKEYKDSFPEIYTLKLEQLSIELESHRKLLSEVTDEMNTDLKNIQNWLLDSSRFNAEDFILKISGSKSEADNLRVFLEDKKITNEMLESEFSLENSET